MDNKNNSDIFDNFLLHQAKKGLLHDNLGLNDICELIFYHRIEAFKKSNPDGFHFDVCMQMFGFNQRFNEQLELGRLSIEGQSKRMLTDLIGKTKEPIVSKQTVKEFLKICDIDLKQEKGCLALNWLYGKQSNTKTHSFSKQNDQPFYLGTLTGKKLKKPQRDRDELTLMIREFLAEHSTNPGDPAPMRAMQAWTIIINNNHPDLGNYISKISAQQELIKPNNTKDTTVDKQKFCKRYNAQFE